MSALIYFISSLLLIAVSAIRYYSYRQLKYALLIALAVAYSAFCFTAYGRMSGLIPTISIQTIIVQKGYNTSVLPLTAETILNICFYFGILFNIFTSLCIWIRWSICKWTLTAATVFCMACACAGPIIGMSPFYSLFGGCCGIMAATGWVLGLSYVEFCVIGNIWIPCSAVLAYSLYLIYAAMKSINGKPILKKIYCCIFIVAGSIEALMMICLLFHYAGTMDYAFYQCVSDLRYSASLLHMTYEQINILIYVIIGVGLLCINILSAKKLLKTNSFTQPSTTNK